MIDTNQFAHTTIFTFLVIGLAVVSIWPNTTLLFGVIALSCIWSLIRFFFADKEIKHKSFLFLVFSAVFVGTAYNGWQLAYNPIDGFTKFLVLLSAALFGLLLTTINLSKSQINLPLSFSLVAIFLTAIFFAVGLFDIPRGDLVTNNRLAGLIIICFPFVGLTYFQTKSRLKWILLFSSLFIFIALMVSGSRGAISALLCGSVAWWFQVKVGNEKTRLSFWGLLAMMITLFIAGIGGYFSASSFLDSSIISIPGAESRIQLYTNHRYLISDYWILGSGLDSFAGHYSQYILSVPFLRFTYGHHLFVDMLLELGILGLLTFVALGAIAFLNLIQTNSKQTNEQLHIHGAILASLIALILHGFIDDAVFGDSGSTFLFIAPGLAFATASRKVNQRYATLIGGSVILLMVVGTLFTFRSTQSYWLSNNAAAEMAKIQLEDWPINEWSKGESVDRLQSIESVFNQALELDPNNSTAYFRLGLIEIEKRNFAGAKNHLEVAFNLRPDHIGIRKNYGYAILWSGDIDQGIHLLSGLEGIDQEIDAYIWWWDSQGETELSSIAKQVKESGQIR